MFGQHGILEKTSYPYAELSIVDVPANAFVPQGAKKVSYAKGVEPGATGLGRAAERPGRHGGARSGSTGSTTSSPAGCCTCSWTA